MNMEWHRKAVVLQNYAAVQVGMYENGIPL